MSTNRNPSLLTIFAFCMVLIAASVDVYRWVKGLTIQADEVRVYRLLLSGKTAPRTVLRLQGAVPQNAASNFVFFADGTVYECLDGGGW